MRPYSASPVTDKMLPEEDLLTGGSNFAGWMSKVKSVGLRQKCWGFITGVRQKQLLELFKANALDQGKMATLIAEGNEAALGVLRCTIADTVLHVIDDCTSAIEAFEKLQAHCSQECGLLDMELVDDLTGLKFTTTLAEYFKDFMDLTKRLTSAGLVLPERVLRKALIRGLPEGMSEEKKRLAVSTAADLKKFLVEVELAYKAYAMVTPEVRQEKPVVQERAALAQSLEVMEKLFLTLCRSVLDESTKSKLQSGKETEN
jgi:hypothetical protein